MQADNKIFDDFAKFINGAAGTLAGVGREAEAGARSRAREWIGGLDFVSDEADALRARLDALEAKSAGTTTTPPSSPATGV
jgi:BMFP domain-containing protein YqiC